MDLVKLFWYRIYVERQKETVTDFTEDTIENYYNDACFSYFQTIWYLFWTFWHCRINTIYMYVHCLKIYNLCVRALETCRKARYLQPVSQRVKINFMFNDNARILCLSYSTKKSKTITKLSENSWNKRRSKRFQRCNMWRQRLYCYHFFLLLDRKQVPEKLYFGQWPYITKQYPVNAIFLLKYNKCRINRRYLQPMPPFWNIIFKVCYNWWNSLTGHILP